MKEAQEVSMHKYLVIIFILFAIPLKTFGFFDSVVTESKNISFGLSASTLILDEFANLYDEGVDFESLYKFSARHNSDLKDISETYNLAQGDYESLTRPIDTKNPLRLASNSMKKYSNLIKILCSWGIESCKVATSVAQIHEQRRTNDILLAEYKRRREVDLKNKIQKIQDTKETISFYKKIENLPENFIQGMKRKFSQ